MPDYRAAARRAAIRAGLDPDVFERQINQESGFNPGARSGAGAIGIAQIMPATARGWHVDPTDPIAALNAAARHMKGYVDQFGSYRNALIAYNAGPGAVGRALPAETQNYIKVILNGKTPPAPRGVSPQAAKASASSPISAAQNAETSFAPLTMPERPKVQATGPAAPSFTAKAVQASTPGPSSVVGNRLTAAGALTALETLQAQTPGTVDNSDKPTGAGASKTSSADAVTGGTGFKGSGVRELFWQGQNGINLKNGQPEPQGFVSGHTDHVHVAAGPKTVVALGKLAQSMGLHVGENPHFGGVNPVHVQGSYHYKDEAIDVSGDVKKMAAFAHRVAGYAKDRTL
jgi:hypothetical protein